MSDGGSGGGGEEAGAGAPPGEALSEEALAAWKSGQEVLAFFRSNDYADWRRFVKVSKPLADSFPYIGLAAGWLKGTVLEDFTPKGLVEADRETHVHVQFTGTFRDPRHGLKEAVALRVHPRHVRSAQSDEPRPLLSIFCVRWWDYRFGSKRSDSDVICDGDLVELFDGPGSVEKALPAEYEVHIAWVKQSEDLASIKGEEVRRTLQARNVVAWYFLQPTRSLRAVPDKAGYVCEGQFFEMCQRLERARVPTGWPHVAHIHRLLAGRLWVPQMCLHPDYKVPPTTRVHYAEFADDNRGAAERAIEALLEVRKFTTSTRDAAASPSEFRGVVKLGFGCPSESAALFCGQDGLMDALHRLMGSRGSDQIACQVQAAVPEVVCTRRIFCFEDSKGEGVVREGLWAPPPWAKGDIPAAGAAALPLDLAAVDVPAVADVDALASFFGGEEAALRDAAGQAEALVDRWLQWFSTEGPETPACVAFDFAIGRSGGDIGTFTAWTWEIRPCGGLLAGLSPGAAALRAAAVLNAAMRFDAASGRFPRPLPRLEEARAS